MSSDPISDMLSAMRNAVAVRKPELVVWRSTKKVAILEAMQRAGYIASHHTIQVEEHPALRIVLSYPDGTPAITGLERVSKPSFDVFVRADKIPLVLNGLGVGIFSTSKGVLTGQEASAKHVGGKYLLKIW